MLLNSFDEWSQLREVVVGSAENYVSHERELSFDLFFHDNLAQDNPGRSEWYYPRVSAPGRRSDRRRLPVARRYVDELNEDLEGLADTLRGLGVTVHRPRALPAETAEVTTPAWSASVVPPLNVRDNTLVLGDEIIETPPMIRSRYFETQLLKPLFQEYFRRGCRWTVMPRPLMTDASFDLSYVRTGTVGGPTEPIGEPRPSPYDVGPEMMFDAAQCLRLGRDIVANVSTENHELGVAWLERHLQGRFRIHRVHRLSDSHIDSMVLALRPGLLLVRSDAVVEALPPALRPLGQDRRPHAHTEQLSAVRRRRPHPDQPLHRPERPVSRPGDRAGQRGESGAGPGPGGGKVHRRAGTAPAPAALRRRVPLLHPRHRAGRRPRGLSRMSGPQCSTAFRSRSGGRNGGVPRW